MTESKPSTVAQIELEKIIQDPAQPRKEFDEEALKELAASITEFGLIEPIVVRGPDLCGHYMLVAGERRWRASRLAGLQTINCVIRTDLDADENRRFALQIVENLQRENLTTAELVAGVGALVDLKDASGKPHGVSGVAQMLSRSKSWVSRRAKAATCAQPIRQLLDTGKITDVDTACELQTLHEEFPQLAKQTLENIAAGERKHYGYQLPHEYNRAGIRDCVERARERAEHQKREEARKEKDPDYVKVNGEWKYKPKPSKTDKAVNKRDQLMRQINEQCKPLRETLNETAGRIRHALGHTGQHGVITYYAIQSTDFMADAYGNNPKPKPMPTWDQLTREFSLDIEAQFMSGLLHWLERNKLRPSWHTDITLSGAQLADLAQFLESGNNRQVQLIAGEQPAAAAPIADACSTFEETVGEFVQQACTTEGDHKTAIADLYDAFLDWCQQTGNRAADKAEFTRELQRDETITPTRIGRAGTKALQGIAIKETA